MDKKRIFIGLTISAAIICAMVFVSSGSWLGLIAMLAVCGLAMNEFYGLLRLGELPASKAMGMISGLLFVAATWYVQRTEATDALLWSLLLIILMINFFRLFFGYPDARIAIRNALGTLFGFVYVAFFWSFFVRIYMNGSVDQPGLTGLWLLAAVKGGDAGAYFVGSRFGKHRLAPAISPKKSWEGLFGGMVVSTLVNVVWWKSSGGQLGLMPVAFRHVLILGLILPAIGTMGDLVESLFKRAVDVKDSGAIAHGMGGMLDMIDSLLFTAPFIYVYVHFINAI